MEKEKKEAVLEIDDEQPKVVKKKRKRKISEYDRRRTREKKKRELKKKREREKERERKKRETEKRRHKRPVGRPKKRGPKKKYKKKKKVVKKRGRPQLLPYTYKIISCRNGKQNKLIGRYRTIEEAYEVFNNLKDNGKNIIFPVSSYGNNVLKNSIDEYVLVQKSDNKKVAMLRNEYGIIIENDTNKDNWSIIDKFRYLKEEDFWVWGYDNKSERKTFLWIFENLLLKELEDVDRYEYKRICTFKNKIVIKSDDGRIDLIICKSIEDSVRFYNLLEQYSKKYKLKNVLFIGDFSKLSKKRKQLEDELIKLTGLPRIKIQMKNTSYFIKGKKGM